jgi:hypothetical protein
MSRASDPQKTKQTTHPFGDCIMAATLIAHVDSAKVDESAIRAVVVPAATATWHPIGHGQLLDLLSEQLTGVGLQIGAKQFSLSNDKNRMFGVFDVVNQDNGDGSVSFAVGLRNSIDKTLPAGICFGARVFVCDNLAFSGEVAIARRHTKNIVGELPGLVSGAVKQFGVFRENHYRLFDALKGVELSHDGISGLIMQAYLNGAIGKTKIADIYEELQNPDHIAKHGADKFGGPLSAWSLYNAGTEVMKGRQARNLIEAAGESIAWHQLFAGKYAPAAPTVVVTVPAMPSVISPTEAQAGIGGTLLALPSPTEDVAPLADMTVKAHPTNGAD